MFLCHTCVLWGQHSLPSSQSRGDILTLRQVPSLTECLELRWDPRGAVVSGPGVPQARAKGLQEPHWFVPGEEAAPPDSTCLQSL